MRAPTAHLQPGSGKITYSDTKLAPTRDNQCSDCVAVLRAWWDGGQVGPQPPPARHGRYKRTQGKSVKLLCGEHKAHRQEQEAKEL